MYPTLQRVFHTYVHLTYIYMYLCIRGYIVGRLRNKKIVKIWTGTRSVYVYVYSNVSAENFSHTHEHCKINRKSGNSDRPTKYANRIHTCLLKFCRKNCYILHMNVNEVHSFRWTFSIFNLHTVRYCDVVWKVINFAFIMMDLSQLIALSITIKVFLG